jgi:acetoin utilization deacetylase AcuC-like enzyme
MQKKCSIITHPVFSDHDTGVHPECAARLEAIDRALRADRELLGRVEYLEPQPASDEAILRCHTEAHLGRLQAAEGRNGIFDPDTVYSTATIEAARRAAGAAMLAVDQLLDGKSGASFALVRPPGHHACPERAMGFCMINNAAVAARHARSRGVEKVLIVDFDVHHGNGTQDIFYDDPTVFYYSLHGYPHFPGTGLEAETGAGAGRGSTLNRPLPHRFPAREYREIYSGDLDRVVASFEPGLAIISAGFDAHDADPLGVLALENEDFWELTRALGERMPPGRVAAVLEGGYNLQVLGDAVCCHLRALCGLPRPGRQSA